MSPDDWQRTKAVFAGAVKLPARDRLAYLEAACAGDELLRASVAALLAQHEVIGDASANGSDVLSIIQRAAANLVEAHSTDGVGLQLGPWKLTLLLARGGMGAVYLAERADGQFEQRTAVKLINPGVLSADARERFNSERQILARLNHPNIARLIDGGTTDEGVPWLAMEYIEGARIDEYCQRQQLDLHARLKLFRKVCAAVAYAHRNLIVHRDIKPSNILVDAHGEPKLLDFGVAKLLATEQSDVTVTERRALTPRYASPEQLRGLPLSTSTDIYSLAVLLYELLVGHDPYRVPSTDMAQLHHSILEVDPQPPSSAVEPRTDSPERNQLRRSLKGDLDNIVLMGLRKEPERRYASVQTLSDDIERYLNDQPVSARPDTWRYRGSKFLKRRRLPVIVTAGALLIVLTLSGVFVKRIIAERDAATAARLRAEQMSQFLQDLLRGADRFASAGKDVTVRDILESGAKRIQLELQDQPVEQARMMQTIADTYESLSLYQPAMELTERALAIRKRELGEQHIETMQSMRMQGLLIRLLGDPYKGLQLLTATRDRQVALLGPASIEVALTRMDLGPTLLTLGRLSEALAEMRAAEEVLNKLPPNHPARSSEPYVLNVIGAVLNAMGDNEGALKSLHQSLTMYEQRKQLDDPVVSAVLHNIAAVLREQGKLTEALPLQRRAVELSRRVLGEHSEDYEAQLALLGRTLAELGRFAEAADCIDRAAAVSAQIWGVEHVSYAYHLVNRARLWALEGHHAKAVAEFARAIAIYRKTYGQYHPALAATEINQADSMIALGRTTEAAELVRSALERMHADPDHERHIEAIGRSVYGRALGRLGRKSTARELLLAALTDLRKMFGDQSLWTTRAARYVVEFLDANGEQLAADEYRGLVPKS